MYKLILSDNWISCLENFELSSCFFILERSLLTPVKMPAEEAPEEAVDGEEYPDGEMDNVLNIDQ